MKVVLAAAGSRGDVVPFGALAARLISRGHDVTLLTHASLLGRLPAEVSAVGVPSDPSALLAGPAANALRRGSPRELNATRHLFAEFLHSFAAPTRDALRGADVLVASTFALAAVDEAMRHDVPVVRAHQWPENAGLDGPMPLLPYGWVLPAPVRREARRALRSMEGYLGGFEGWWERGRLRIVPEHPVGLSTTTLGALHAFSPLIDVGAAARAEAATRVTGWWRPAAPETLSPGTEELLESGDRWVYVGFGSMHQRSPQILVELVAQACRRVGVRAVIQLRGAPSDPSGTVVRLGEEPHAELFRRVHAVVHHGGSGTTGAAVTAGVPAVVVPHFADQFYWAHRLHALRVAPAGLPRPLLTERRLAARLKEVLEPGMLRRAERLGSVVAAEDGTGAAVEHLEWLVRRGSRP